MTRINSEMPTGELLAVFRKYQQLQRLAFRRDDVPAANRHYDKVFGALDAILAKGEEGRQTVEALLSDEDPFIRLRAAGEVLAWDAEKAVPVLGRLLVENLGADASVDERIEIKTEAKGRLYRHFGIRSYDRNDLIEPLRPYDRAVGISQAQTLLKDESRAGLLQPVAAFAAPPKLPRPNLASP